MKGADDIDGKIPTAPSEAPEAPEAPDMQPSQGAGSMGSDEDFRVRSAKLMRAALKSASKGIDKGVSMDLASRRAAGSIFTDIAEVIVAPLVFSTPGRALERNIKGSGGLTDSSLSINLEAKKRLQQRIIGPSLNLYESNFSGLIKVIDKLPIFKNIVSNDTANIEAMAIEFKGLDESTPSLSQGSPYKVIIKQIIPILREKFDAVVSFDESLGEGSKIEFDEIAERVSDGIGYEIYTDELERFYKAITEWRDILGAFSNSSLSLKALESKEKAEAEGKADLASEETEEKLTEKPLPKDIYISAVRPGKYVSRNKDGLVINNSALINEDTPVVKLFLKGGGKDDVNSAGSGERYLQYFIDSGQIILSENVDIRQAVYNVTRESVSKGSEVSLYFNPNSLEALRGGSVGRVEIMTVRARMGEVLLFLDDVSQVKHLNRVASTETTPYYEAVSPSGKVVHFTPSDLVISGGTLKDPKTGKSFKPKGKVKGRSLAHKVQSKNYGKVKRSGSKRRKK